MEAKFNTEHLECSTDKLSFATEKQTPFDADWMAECQQAVHGGKTEMLYIGIKIVWFAQYPGH